MNSASHSEIGMLGCDTFFQASILNLLAHF
jgi:hypothetical protein